MVCGSRQGNGECVGAAWADCARQIREGTSKTGRKGGKTRKAYIASSWRLELTMSVRDGKNDCQKDLEGR